MSYSYERLDKVLKDNRTYFMLIDRYSDEEIDYLSLNGFVHYVNPTSKNKVFVSINATETSGFSLDFLFYQLTVADTPYAIPAYPSKD